MGTSTRFVLVATFLHKLAFAKLLNWFVSRSFGSAMDTTDDIKLKLIETKTESLIQLWDSKGLLGSLHYVSRTHSYRAHSDFRRLSTELQTYGYSHGLLPEWDRIVADHKNKSREGVPR